MNMRRGLTRLMLLATLAWVTFVAYSAWGNLPKYDPPVAVTQLAEHCRYNFRVMSNMRVEIVRYEAIAQYHRQKTTVRNANCRAFQQTSEAQVADSAARRFVLWLDDQRLASNRQFNTVFDNWLGGYLIHALAPPLLVWLVLFAALWVGDGFTRREED